MIPRELSATIAALADQMRGGGQTICHHPAAARVVAGALTELGLPARAVTTPAELAGSRGEQRIVATCPIPSGPSPIIYLAHGDWPRDTGAAVLSALSEHPRAHRAAGALVRATSAAHQLRPPVRWPEGTLPGGPRLSSAIALTDIDEPVFGDRLRAEFGSDGEFPAYLRPHCERVLASWRPRRRPEVVVAAPWPHAEYRMHHGALGVSRILDLPFAGQLVGPAEVMPAEPANRVRQLARHVRLDVARLDVGKVSGKRVLLVGQMWEEGWTMSMFAQLLLAAGAGEVAGLALARRTPWTSPLPAANPAARR